MVYINRGEPQPKICLFCNAFWGYQVSDNLHLSYTTVYDYSGRFSIGFYSDYSKVTKTGTTPYCAECGNIIKGFKLNK